MNLKIQNPGFQYMIDIILEFQTEGTADFWAEPLYYFYPKLDKKYADSLSFEGKKEYFEQTFKSIYKEQENIINDKIELYSKYWEKCKPQITEALSDAFEVDCENLLNDMICNISLNPIEPRYLQEHTFDIFYLNSEKGFIGEAIHEIIHFVWFHVWNKVFNDSFSEYETPSLKWILSEMVVESIMRDSRLSSINPSFPRENGGCIYPYFFDMMVDNKYILDTLDEMYQNQSITDFMKNSYDYCLNHEEEIREHIKKSEQSI